MRSTHVARLAALAAAATLVLAGCGSDSSEPEADAAGSTSVAAATTAPATTAAAETTAAASDFGPPVTLKTLSGEPLEVTLLQLEDPAESDVGALEPAEGRRYMAAELRIANTGSQEYDDTPSNGADVVDTEGVEWAASVFDPVDPGFGSLTIPAGETVTAWISFEVPEGATLETLKFATNSGFGGLTRWSLR